MKKSDHGYNVPAVSKYIGVFQQQGRVSLYETKGLPVGKYDVFVQYDTGKADPIDLKNLPYQKAVFVASAGKSQSLTFNRK